MAARCSASWGWISAIKRAAAVALGAKTTASQRSVSGVAPPVVTCHPPAGSRAKRLTGVLVRTAPAGKREASVSIRLEMPSRSVMNML